MSLQPPTPAARPSESGWEWTQVALLLASVSWTTLCLGGFRAETLAVTGVLNGVLVAVHLLSRVFAPGEPGPSDEVRRFHPAGWLFVPFLAYAAVNAAGRSPAPWIGWRDWLGWAQAFAVFWVMLNGVRSPRARAGVFYALAGLALVAVAMAGYQRFVEPDWLMLGRTQSPYFLGRGSGPFGIPNSLGAFLILLIPAVAGLGFRRGATPVRAVWCTYVALLLVGGLLLTISRGAWLALGVVLLVWPVLAIRRSWLRRATFAGVVLVVLAVVGTTLVSQSPRAQRRLAALLTDRGELSRAILWRGAWQLFREEPVRGHGAASFNVLFERHRPERFLDEPLWPHNEYLNLVDDHGLAGAGLLGGAVIVVLLAGARARRQRRLAAATAPPVAPGVVSRPRYWWPVPRQALAAGLAAFAVQAAVEFSWKIPALALAFSVIAALWVDAAWPAPERTAPRTWWRSAATVAGAGGVLIGTIGFVYPAYRAEALRAAARESIDRISMRALPEVEWLAVLTPAKRDLQRAVALDPGNGAAWSDLSFALALSARIEGDRAQQGREAERAADQALAQSVHVPEFWLRRGVALDLQGEWVQAGAAFVRALTLAPARSDVWYYEADHLARVRSERRRALAAAELCLRLDPGNREAQALRAQLADRIRAH